MDNSTGNNNTQIPTMLLFQQNNDEDDDQQTPHDGDVQGIIFTALLFSLVGLGFLSLCIRHRSRVNAEQPRQEDASQLQRPKPNFKKLLSATTMKVDRKDVTKVDESQQMTSDKEAPRGGEFARDVMFDIELGDASEHDQDQLETKSTNNSRRISFLSRSSRSSSWLDDGINYVLQLPSNVLNGDRVVTAGCAICLGSFKPGEQVSWSPNPTCPHAYHTQCIVPYAGTSVSKKKTNGDDHSVACPMCRETFIKAATLATKPSSSTQTPFTDPAATL